MGATSTESFAAMAVISVPALAIGMEDEMHIKRQTVAAPLLTHGQLQRELAYRVAMGIPKRFVDAGDAEEGQRADAEEVAA